MTVGARGQRVIESVIERESLIAGPRQCAR